MSLSLKARFAVTSTLLFLAAMWLPLQYAFHSLRSSIQTMLAAELAADIDHMANDLGDNLRYRRAVLETIAGNVDPGWLRQPQRLQAYLQQRRELLSMFGLGIAIASPGGLVLADYPAVPGRQGANFGGYPSYQGVMNQGRTTLGVPMRSEFSGNPVCDIATPIRNAKGELVGIVSGAINLAEESLMGRPGNIKLTGFSYFLIEPTRRQFVSASDPSWTLKPVFAELDGLLDRASWFPLGQDTSLETGGQQYVASLRPVAGSSWLLLGLRRTEVALGPVAVMERQILWFGGLLSLLMLLLVWRLGVYLLRPLEKLARRLEGRLQAPGDEQRINPDGPPEVKRIADGYNRLAARVEAQTRSLSEEKERFRILADTSPVLLLLSNANGEIYWVNETWREFTGAGKGSGILLPEVLHPDECEGILRQRKAYHDARLPFDAEFRLLRDDGSYRWVHGRSVPVFSGNGEYVGDVMSCVDVTSRKTEAEEQSHLLEENRKLVASIFHVIEQERQKIARDLHDDVGQWITAIRANAASISRLFPDAPLPAQQALDAIGNCAISLHAAVRRMLQDLRPSHMDTLELADGLREFVDQWQRAFPAFACELDVATVVPAGSHDVRVALYRVVQESLTNVARHSAATRVTVCLRQNPGLFPGDERIELEIVDDGVGFSQERGNSGSLGLVGMRERIMAVRGEFRLHSLPGRGTRIFVSVPPGPETKEQ